MFEDLTFGDFAAGIGGLAVAGTGIYAVLKNKDERPVYVAPAAQSAAPAPAPQPPATVPAPATTAASQIPWGSIGVGVAVFVGAILLFKAIK